MRLLGTRAESGRCRTASEAMARTAKIATPRAILPKTRRRATNVARANRMTGSGIAYVRAAAR
jgi:hypothetical protein